MKFRIRKPSFKKSLSARFSIKRKIKKSLGLNAPRGWGWLFHPKKASYNKAYNRKSTSIWSLVKKILK